MEGQLYLVWESLFPTSRGAGLSGNGCPLEANWLVAPASHHSPQGQQFFRDSEGGDCGLGRGGGRPTSGRSAEGR